MSRKKNSAAGDTAQANFRRENALRPSRFLGYDHNSLAMYLLERGAYTIAESELRRALWLNPYEPAFLANLAWCLHKIGRDDEARDCLTKALDMHPDREQVRRIAALMGSVVESADTRSNDEAQI